MSNKVKKVLKAIVCIAFWLGVWVVLSLLVNKNVILPTPAATVKKLWELLGTGKFYLSCLSSLGRVTLGFLIGTATGVISAVLSQVGAETIISPAISVIKATPVVSVIIVMLFFINRGAVPISATALMVTPIIYSNVLKGIRSVEPDADEVAKVYGFSRARRLKYLVIPSAAPYFSAGCRSAVGLAWKAGVAAEVICTPSMSVGAALWDAKTYLESEELFAWTLTVVILSFFVEKLLVAGVSRLTGGRKNA